MSRSQRVRKQEFQRVRSAAVAWVSALALLFATSASADVDLYLSPEFGISGMISDTDGQAENIVPLIFSGEDNDESPLIGLAVGLAMPLDEMLPREWLADIRLPNWPIRFELEASGLREYDLSTKKQAEDFFSRITATTTFANVVLDIPMSDLWKPFQYMFGLGRQPRMRSLLEPLNFYFGSGVGFTAMTFEGTDNVFKTKDNVIDFAWNVGAGLRYQISDRVSISSGYRYVGLGPDTGSQEIDLRRRDLSQRPGDSLEYDFQVHELLIGVQIRVFSFRGAWR